MGCTIGIDGCIKRIPIVGPRLGNDALVVAVLVGVGLEVGSVGVEHRAVDEPFADRLLDDPIKDLLRDECLNETAFSSLSEARSLLTEWQSDYNHVRPHSALANQTREEFKAHHSALAATPLHGQNFNPGLSI